MMVSVLVWVVLVMIRGGRPQRRDGLRSASPRGMGLGRDNKGHKSYEVSYVQHPFAIGPIRALGGRGISCRVVVVLKRAQLVSDAIPGAASHGRMHLQ